MHINYKIEKLQEIIQNLGELLGVCIQVLDNNARSIASYDPNIREDYCKTMQAYSDFHEKCAFCDKKIIEQCQKSSKAEFHYCHAGLCDVAMPIIKNGVLAAYIILGKIRASNSPTTSSEHPELYKKVTVFTDKQLENLTNLLPYIVFDSAITLENDSISDDIVEYVRSNLSADLSITALCQRFFISKSTLYKVFEKEYKCTLREFIASERLSVAAQLLSNTDVPITEVSEKAGYINYSCFCKAFKKHYNTSPSEYRKSSK